MTNDEMITRLEEFKVRLKKQSWQPSAEDRTWLNQNVDWARRTVIEARCFTTLSIRPPPLIGGLVLKNVDPFRNMFESPYGLGLDAPICDMIDRTIGNLRNPPPARDDTLIIPHIDEILDGFAFIAMAMDENDHQLIDVLEAIKDAAKDCSITAERVDDEQSNERITDRILQSIRRAQYVIADLSNERPNVFYEAGYAQALGKTPIYLARHGTKIHFDVKDFPIIFYKNMRDLKLQLKDRLVGLAQTKRPPPTDWRFL